jgi:hypothetical protein
MYVKPVQCLVNGTAISGGTIDTSLVTCRGARAVYFVFTSANAAVFAAGSAFQLLVQAKEDQIGVIAATPSQFELSVPNATNLNGAAQNSQKSVVVVPSQGSSSGIGQYAVGARLTAGAANMSDIDVTAYVVY